MPRNPNPVHCVVPHCGNWAMRGRTRCRTHLHHVLGPGLAGPPRGNLNAVRHARYSFPLSPDDVDAIVCRLRDAPAAFPEEIGALLQSLYDRTADPFSALCVLYRILPDLGRQLAVACFESELPAYLESEPDATRSRVEAVFRNMMARTSPERGLLFLRRQIHRKNDRRNREGDGAPPPQAEPPGSTS